ncbi:MAG: tRNA (adenosine(37)-N6)-threonylcarbamoyltransferase complex transferase subunit TsaD [Rhodospirillales bacterium]|nr:tRNA (adenosine(37)-N6)-threonylcarbamoyltransferase complex transferase subunit TsaD [Rhodospirillales bacterium]MCW8952085.1 tRNA (adenosine(37)-N6)-threonylcarbamoyltransferase complex transferase subunit TsaD [Rhodospirillales bacterium]
MIVLGIETSCDETAAAVVSDCDAEGRVRLPGERILGQVVLSQIEEHRAFGGVVPEVAARAHLEHTDRIVGEAMARAGIGYADLDAVAATGGPGLIGGVIVGVMTGKAIALAHDLPFVAVNHLEGHALSARLSNDVPFPYLLLLVSGGHCQLLVVEDVGRYRRLGTTIDDALGEAFDKTAKMLGLGYPGGPAVEQAAAMGDPTRFSLPRPMKGREGCHFSFSGLKTAVRQAIESFPPGPLTQQDAADICAAFHDAVTDVLDDRVSRALQIFRDLYPEGGPLVVAGGVAANKAIRARLESVAARAGTTLIAPPIELCTDNGAMIAWAGIERRRAGQCDGLDFAPRPRWPLDPDAPKASFAGVKA